jgi:hypothetical protein
MSAPFEQRLRRRPAGPGAPCPPGLRTWNGSDPAQRFAVYRNNVVVSLIDALADTFPVVQQLVGPDFFRAMAGVFVRRPPAALAGAGHYGQAFPAFIARFPPAQACPIWPTWRGLKCCAWWPGTPPMRPRCSAEMLAARAGRSGRLPQLRIRRWCRRCACWPRPCRSSRCGRPTSPRTAALALAGIDTVRGRDCPGMPRRSRRGDLRLDPVPPVSSPAAARRPALRRGRAAAWPPIPFDPAATLALLLGAGAIAHHHPEETVMNTAMTSIANAPAVPVRLAPRHRPAAAACPTGRWIALLGRFAIAGIFWKSGQTKIEGWPSTSSMANSSSACRACPIPWWTCSATSTSCRCCRPSSPRHHGGDGRARLPAADPARPGDALLGLALLVMTATIQFLVYPDAWPTMASGPRC